MSKENVKKLKAESEKKLIAHSSKLTAGGRERG
jgi:hypothetical protein